jgi:hypothetical protein
LYNTGLAFKRNSLENIEKLRQQLIDKEAQNATFHPKTQSNSIGKRSRSVCKLEDNLIK